ncbi:hypothetical protein SAMN04488134_11251 [Amphibacillus marinus]|uniref:Uncharacterized protein n=1 Tax=Amphibacillus marinus TaxID=872970 RepID=A0A1H8S9I7_9BACI|nr:hypothetical protein [Amphibacillus marinus]SEO75331.1 hypothetical protein SAMN04488134_11251 [Amphibacillus marinus]
MRTKKISVISVLIGLVATLFILPNVTFAQEAPPLTYLNIAAITSDGDNYQWHYPESEFLNTGYTASGNEVILAIYIEGFILRNSLRVFVDDVDITNEIYEPLPREDILGPGNLVTGFIYYKAIPLSYFENENIGKSDSLQGIFIAPLM